MLLLPSVIRNTSSMLVMAMCESNGIVLYHIIYFCRGDDFLNQTKETEKKPVKGSQQQQRVCGVAPIVFKESARERIFHSHNEQRGRTGVQGSNQARCKWRSWTIHPEDIPPTRGYESVAFYLFGTVQGSNKLEHAYGFSSGR